MTENPYASPTSASDAFPDSDWDPNELRLASQGRRFLNWFIDYIFVQVFSYMMGFVLVFFAIAADETTIMEDEAALDIASFILGIALTIGYYAVMEIFFQKTVAKFITGTVVVTATGERPSTGQIVGRSFARFIPFDAFSFLFGRKPPVGWHDSLSGTRVITTR